MANIDMKTLTIGENTYIIIDAGARALIGDLSNLDTTAKNNLVAAINELFQSGGGSSVEPYTSDPADLGSSASPGSSNKFSRGDHVHKKPTPADIGAGTYSKPSGGIPKTDLASAVQTSLGKADSAYQKPSGGVPKTDLASAVQTSLGKADSAYQKPSGGIPASDLASGVIPTVPDAATNAPLMDGTAAVGTSTKYAKEDHVHPSDTSKADAWGYEEIDDDGAVTQALDAGKIYFFSGALTALTITLNQSTAPAQYHYIFDGEPTLTMPNTVVMPDDFQVDASKHYEIDILTVDGANYFGTAQSW